MLKDLGRSLLGRLVSLGVFALGFWLLYQGLLRDDNPYLLVLGTVLGSALILGGLYLMATTRRIAARQMVTDSDEDARRTNPLIPSMEAARAINYHRKDALWCPPRRPCGTGIRFRNGGSWTLT